MDRVAIIRELEHIIGSFSASSADLQGEADELRDDGEADWGIIDGAIFHAEEGLRRLTALRQTNPG